MYTKLICLVALASAALAADAEAKPRRVVVLEFDGPRRLADSGRSTVMSVLGDQYNIVATKNWDTARARAAGRGPQQWRQASKQAGVDAVIEGWVQAEGRHHVLTVAVREAATGRELDTLSIRIKGDGVTPEASQRLAVQLDDLLGWIDGDINADPTPTLPDVRTMRPMLGARDPDRDRRRIADEEDEREDEELDEDRPRRKKSRRDRDGRDDGRGDDDRDDRAARDDRDRDERDRDDRDRDDDDRDDRRSDRADEPKRAVATIDESTQDTNDLVKLFGPDSKEAEIVSEGKTTHVPKPTPRFVIAAGPYVSARGMAFTYDPEAKGAPPEYPGQTLKGFQANAAVYPMPRQKEDGRLSGVGFSFGIAKSVLSTFVGMDDTGTGEYDMNHSAWELGVHYRWPIDLVSVDIDANFGNFAYRIVDLPSSIQVPDTSYSYVGARASVDLQVTDAATVGFGARYLYTFTAGDISEQDWYGFGRAWGAALDGNFVIPISRALFVRGDVAYTRVSYDIKGPGMLAQQWGVSNVVDSSIAGSGNIGVKF